MITELKLQKPYQNVDPVSLTNNIEKMENCYLDEMGAINKRPGLTLFCDLLTGLKIDGMYWWLKDNCMYVVSGGRIYKISDNEGTYSDITNNVLVNGNKVSFAEVYDSSTLYLFMANGDRIVYTDGTNTTYIADGDAPTSVKSIAHLDTYLIAQGTGQTFHLANPNAPLTWAAGDEYDAEMSTDGLLYLTTCNRQLYLFGNNSIETWYNSGTPGDPFMRRLSGMYVDNGVYKSGSINKIPIKGIETLTFIDKRRNVVGLQGDSTQILSNDISKYINDISVIEDVFSDNITISGRNFLLYGFRQSKKTIAFDYTTGSWSEWTSHTNSDETDSSFNYSSYAYAKDWNMDLIGGLDGKIYKLSNSIYDDNGNMIKMKIVTGNINHGSDGILKNSKGLCIRLKRGIGKTGNIYESPYLMIRHRDNGSQYWSNYQHISLGAIGQTELNVWINKGRNGCYYTRQYEITLGDNAPCVIAGIWEDVDGK